MGVIGYLKGKVLPQKFAASASNLFFSPETAMRYAERSLRRQFRIIQKSDSDIRRAVNRFRSISPSKSPKEWENAVGLLQSEMKSMDRDFREMIDDMYKADMQLQSTIMVLVDTVIMKLVEHLGVARKTGLDDELYSSLYQDTVALESEMLIFVDQLRLEERRQKRGAFVLQQISLSSTRRVTRAARRLSRTIKTQKKHELDNLGELADSFEHGDPDQFMESYKSVLKELRDEFKNLDANADDNLVVAYRARKAMNDLISFMEKQPRELQAVLNPHIQTVQSWISYEQTKIADIGTSMVGTLQTIRNKLSSSI